MLNGSNVLVLLSGGIDSTASIVFYLKQKFDVQSIFIDFGQLSAKNEYQAATKISKYYKIPLTKITCSNFHNFSKGFILGRNAFFLFTALMQFKFKSGLIAIGIHSGTPYIDCSDLFIQNLQSIFDLYTDGRIQIGTSFLKWNKIEIWDFCKQENIPIELTYSCELGNEQPCNECLSCKDLMLLNAC